MASGQQLPALGLVGEALRDVLGRLGGLVRIAWLYFAVATALILLGALSLGGSEAGPGGWLMSTLGGGMGSIVLSIGTLACIVKWQRHVVLGEPLTGLAPLDGRTVRYVVWSAVVGLLAAIPIALGAMLGRATGLIRLTPDEPTPFAIDQPGIALLVASAVVGIYLFARLGLALPAVSVDDRTTRLRASWAATSGHGLRLTGILLLYALGMGLLGAIGALLAAALVAAAPAGGAAGPILEQLLNGAIDYVTAVAGASITAQIYRRLRSPPA